MDTCKRNKNPAKISQSSKKTRSNHTLLTERKVAFVKRLDNWMLAAADREKFKEKVFSQSSQRPNVAKLVSEIFGISESKIYRIRKESEPMEQSENEETRGRPQIKLDDFNKNALSRLIHSFYTRPKPEIPTLDKIHAETLCIAGFPSMSRAALHRCIKKLGFVCKKETRK